MNFPKLYHRPDFSVGLIYLVTIFYAAIVNKCNFMFGAEIIN
jgi:hypothetical protein